MMELDCAWYEPLLVEAMAKAGVDAALIYAFTKTGFIVTESNVELLSERELGQWNRAIDEYHDRGGGNLAGFDC